MLTVTQICTRLDLTLCKASRSRAVTAIAAEYRKRYQRAPERNDQPANLYAESDVEWIVPLIKDAIVETQERDEVVEAEFNRLVAERTQKLREIQERIRKNQATRTPRKMTALEVAALDWLLSVPPPDLGKFLKSLQFAAAQWLNHPQLRQFDAPLSPKQFECLTQHFRTHILPSRKYEARLQEQRGEQVAKLLQPSSN